MCCVALFAQQQEGKGYRERERACSGLPQKHFRFVGLLLNLSEAPLPPQGKKSFNNAKIGAAGEFPIPLAQEATFADLERILLLGTDAFDDTWKPIPAVAGREAPEPLCFQCCPST